MEDLAQTQGLTETPPQPDTHSSSASDFEEELRRQNISTMIEIFGEGYATKMDILMR